MCDRAPLHLLELVPFAPSGGWLAFVPETAGQDLAESLLDLWKTGPDTITVHHVESVGTIVVFHPTAGKSQAFPWGRG
jgi:hypothetical protein